MSSTLAAALELRGIFLHECDVKRGDASHETPGRVSSHVGIEPNYDDGSSVLTYLMTASHRFNNSDDQLVAEISVSMAALYDFRGEDEPAESAVQEFGKTNVMIHVTPFVREFLASMTNRLGLPVFYLPLLSLKRTNTDDNPRHDPVVRQPGGDVGD